MCSLSIQIFHAYWRRDYIETKLKLSGSTCLNQIYKDHSETLVKLQGKKDEFYPNNYFALNWNHILSFFGPQT